MPLPKRTGTVYSTPTANMFLSFYYLFLLKLFTYSLTQVWTFQIHCNCKMLSLSSIPKQMFYHWSSSTKTSAHPQTQCSGYQIIVSPSGFCVTWFVEGSLLGERNYRRKKMKRIKHFAKGRESWSIRGNWHHIVLRQIWRTRIKTHNAQWIWGRFLWSTFNKVTHSVIYL